MPIRTPKHDTSIDDNNMRTRTRTAGIAALIFLAMIANIATPSAVTAVPQYTFDSEFGSFGTGDGQFNHPENIAIDSSTGRLYIADSDNNRIQVFDSSGTFLSKFGTHGSGDGQFIGVSAIAIGNDGKIYTADTYNHRIQVFDSSGTFLSKFPACSYTEGVALDKAGNIWVTCHIDNVVKKFDSTGTFIKQYGSAGSGDGQFNDPFRIIIDGQDNIYVVERFGNRVQKFDSNFNFLLKFGTQGSGDGEFSSPIGIALDDQGNMLVTDCGNNRVQVFDQNGGFITKFGTQGSGDGEFNCVTDVAINSGLSKVYVSDYNNHRIQVFKIGTLDTTPPTVTSTSPADGATNVAVDISGIKATFSEDVKGVDDSSFKVNNGTADIAGTVTYDSASKTATFTPSAKLNYGTKYTATLSSAITDQAGNPLATTSWSFRTEADTIPPDTKIDSAIDGNGNAVPYSGTTSSSEITFKFSGTDNVAVDSFECSLDGAAAFTACTSPVTYKGLADGQHSFNVRAVDASGNPDPTPADHKWSAQVPPDTKIDSAVDAKGKPISNGGSTTSNTITFKFSGTDNSGVASFQCSKDSPAFSPCTSPLTYTKVTKGTHTFKVKAIDTSGIADPTPATFTWTKPK